MTDRLVLKPAGRGRAKLLRRRAGRIILRGRVEQLDGSSSSRSPL
jgi:hypothetical protein